MQPALLLHTGKRVLQRRCICNGRFLQLKLYDLYICVPGLLGDASSMPARDEHWNWGLRASPKRTPIVTLELLGFRTHTFHIFNSGALGGFPCPLTPLCAGVEISICFIRGGDAYRGPTLPGRGAALENRTGRVRGGGGGGGGRAEETS